MFEIKPYTRKELAYIYFPNSFTPKTACQSFRRLLEKCPKGIASVSDTHLDVYKRQIIPRTSAFGCTAC